MNSIQSLRDAYEADLEFRETSSIA
jgi:hypothetical protein